MDTNIVTRLPGSVRAEPAQPVKLVSSRNTEAAPTESSASTEKNAETAAASEPDEAQLREIAEDLNVDQQVVRRSLKFSVVGQGGKTVIEVVDNETKEVIRQIPPEVAIKISESIRDSAGGLIQDEV